MGLLGATYLGVLLVSTYLGLLSLSLLFLETQVFFALTMMATGVSQSSNLARDFSKVQEAAASIFRIIDRSSKIDASSEEGTTLGTVEGHIEFQHVSFKYPARTDLQIFRDLCLRILSGKVLVVFMI